MTSRVLTDDGSSRDESPHEPEIFHYIIIENEGRRYFCLEQSVLVLAWILYFKKSSFVPIWQVDTSAPVIIGIFRRMRHYFGVFRVNARLLIKFFCYKQQFRNMDSVLKFSFYAQMCLPVHKGFKFFDFQKKVVRKVFSDEVSISVIVNEIEHLRRVSGNDFGPNITVWNIDERWYEEDYVDGFLDSSQNPMNITALLEHFRDEVVQIMESLVLFKKPLIADSLEYIQDVMTGLPLISGSTLDRNLKESCEITLFTQSLVERIRSKGNYPIHLVFSHGDFVPANMLITSQGIRLVDWEEANSRSAMYDFYCYFFYRPLFTKTDIRDLVLAIRGALPIFIATIAKEAPELAVSVENHQDLYRHTFFIEMLGRLMKRELTDSRLNIRVIIKQYLNIFSRYEELQVGMATQYKS